MKKIMKIIPALALVIGAGMAFAGVTPAARVPDIKSGLYQGEPNSVVACKEGG